MRPLPQTDGLRLDESIDALEGLGFASQFTPRPEGRVGCGACGRSVPASSLQVLGRSRVEGVSDPADESLVFGVACPACGARGTLVLAYGPRARRDEAQVLDRLARPSGTARAAA